MSIRLPALAAASIVAGCGLNPFGGDDSSASSEPVPSVSRAPASGPQSLEGRVPAAATTVTRPDAGATTSERSGTAVPIAENAPQRYVVKRGDTLWDISATFLRDPWYWPEIWQVNPQVENPHLIYPGDILSLIYVDGQPRLFLERGIQAQRLSPQIREQRLEEAINTIAYEQIAAFLTRSEVIAREEIDSLPYMISSRGDHLIAGAGNDIYVRPARDGEPLRAPGARYNVVEIGDPLVDPDDNDVIGYEALYVAEGRVRRDGDPGTVRLTESFREATPGDKLIDREVDIPLNFFPKAPASEVNGQIISVVDGVSLIGQYQVVVLNRGERHGLAPGDVLSVYAKGEVIRDRFANASGFRASGMLGGERVTLPDEFAGTVLVFKSYDRISYALVMAAESEINILDVVRNPS